VSVKHPRPLASARPSLLTPEQVAAELSIGRGTLAKLLEQGRQGDPLGLRSVRLAPQVIRVPRSEIEAFIARHLAASDAGDQQAERVAIVEG
jgi:predicted DNA-binding transcriptional regulator AlpA